MPFCSNCGQPVHAAAKFCDSCGTALSGSLPVSPTFTAVPAPLPPPIVVKPQRGRLLALKGFLLFLVVAAIANSAATTAGGNTSVRDGGMLFASGISAAYIITNLQKWKRENQPMKDANIGWTVAGVLLLVCLGTLIGMVRGENGTPAPSQANSTPSAAPPPSQAGSKRAAPPPQAAAAEENCGTGKTCRVRSGTGGTNVFVFASEDALKEVKASSSMDATRREVTALTFAGEVYMVPNGTTVTVLDWSVWHGWHKVRIVSAGAHIGSVGYILDQWTVFE